MTAGLILAAGSGSRFGDEPKLLAELDGRPLLEHAIRAQSAVARLSRIVVVLGAGAERILAAVDFGRAEPVTCDEWSEGQAASLRCGARALAGADKVIVTLGDEPLISSEAIALLVDADPGARATYDGLPGHPVALGPEHLHALLSRTGDRGARDLLRGGELIECGHLCCGRDVDTIDDLEQIRRLRGRPSRPGSHR